MTFLNHTPLGQLDRENNWLSIQNPNNYINVKSV
jgi:hypothetical protein